MGVPLASDKKLRFQRADVWCCNWQRCKGVFVPGFYGGGEVVLCEACERERLAALPQPQPKDEGQSEKV